MWSQIRALEESANLTIQRTKRLEQLIVTQNDSIARHTKAQETLVARGKELSDRLGNLRSSLKQILVSKGTLAIDLGKKRRVVSQIYSYWTLDSLLTKCRYD